MKPTFVELTLVDSGDKRLINLADIVWIGPSDGTGAHVWIASCDLLLVVETYADIFAALEAGVNSASRIVRV